MNQRSRTQLTLGIILILAALWMIAIRIWPERLGSLFNLPLDAWPLWVVLSGAAILVIGMLVGAPGMAVPACIVAGIGGILYYCNSSEQWEAWSYLWTLIPGFGGIGVLLSGILGGDIKESARHALNLLVVSAILFVIFASLLGGAALLGPFSPYGPTILLFLLGLWLIIRGVVRRK